MNTSATSQHNQDHGYHRRPVKHRLIRILLGYVAAVFVTGMLASVVQTQLNLVAISEISPPISFAMRLDNTLHDLQYFSPLMLTLVGLTFLVAFPIAGAINRVAPGHRLGWYIAGGTLGLWATFYLVDSLAPMPTLIAATRTLNGTLIMLLTAAIGAGLFAYISSSDWEPST